MTFVPLVRASRLREGLRLVRRRRGVRLLLLHESGRTRVVEDLCPHMGARLARGDVDGDALWCPKHGFCYALDDGRRLSPPVGGGREERLAVFPVIERDGWVGTELP